MIGFDELGSKGWLGNQMFQYAALRGIAANRGYDFCIPPDDETRLTNYELHNTFKLKSVKNLGYIGGLYKHPTYVIQLLLILTNNFLMSVLIM